MLPLGYSFNLDGTMMYTTFATLFIAQAYGIELPLATQIGMSSQAVNDQLDATARSDVLAIDVERLDERVGYDSPTAEFREQPLRDERR